MGWSSATKRRPRTHQFLGPALLVVFRAPSCRIDSSIESPAPYFSSLVFVPAASTPHNAVAERRELQETAGKTSSNVLPTAAAVPSSNNLPSDPDDASSSSPPLLPDSDVALAEKSADIASASFAAQARAGSTKVADIASGHFVCDFQLKL